MPGMSQPLDAVPGDRRRLQARNEAAGVPRRPHPRHRLRPPRHRGRPARHGGDDARPHGRSADRQQADARRGGTHPPLRRRLLLHVQKDHLHPQPGDRPRADRCRRSIPPPPHPAARWWWSAAAPAAWKRRASRPSAAIASCCSRPRAKLGGQLLIAVRATWRRDLIAIVDWRAAELARLGVDVRLDSYADRSGRAGRTARTR